MYKKTDFNVRFPFFPMIAIFPAYVTLSTCLFDLLLQFIKDRRAEERAESHVQPSQSFLIRLIVTSLRRPSSMLKTVEGVTPERYASSFGSHVSLLKYLTEPRHHCFLYAHYSHPAI